jgi:hypothetical protein
MGPGGGGGGGGVQKMMKDSFFVDLPVNKLVESIM